MAGLKTPLVVTTLFVAIAAGGPVGAQSAGDFRLQPGGTATEPRAQGPVDPETPRAPPAAATSPVPVAPATAAQGANGPPVINAPPPATATKSKAAAPSAPRQPAAPRGTQAAGH